MLKSKGKVCTDALIQKITARAQAAALVQAGISVRNAAKQIKKSSSFVQKWAQATQFEDASRSGRPATALTPKNLKKMKRTEGKSNNSNRKLGQSMNISKSSVSFGFLHKLGMPSYRRDKDSKMKQNHIRWRYECSKIHRFHSPTWWEQLLITDEKIWTVNGMLNKQNDRVRAFCKEGVAPRDQDKFSGSRMACWG